MVVLPLLCGAVQCGLRRALRVNDGMFWRGSIADTRSGVAFLTGGLKEETDYQLASVHSTALFLSAMAHANAHLLRAR